MILFMLSCTGALHWLPFPRIPFFFPITLSSSLPVNLSPSQSFALPSYQHFFLPPNRPFSQSAILPLGENSFLLLRVLLRFPRLVGVTRSRCRPRGWGRGASPPASGGVARRWRCYRWRRPPGSEVPSWGPRASGRPSCRREIQVSRREDLEGEGVFASDWGQKKRSKFFAFVVCLVSWERRACVLLTGHEGRGFNSLCYVV